MPVEMMTKSAKAIPVVQRRVITDPANMPHNLSQTPGGTLYGTTPGGSRIVYERNFMLSLRESPLSKTPPTGMGTIPEEIMAGYVANKGNNKMAAKKSPQPNMVPEIKANEDDMFKFEV